MLGVEPKAILPLFAAESIIKVEVAKSNVSAFIWNVPPLCLIKLLESFIKLKSPLPLKNIPAALNDGEPLPSAMLPPPAVFISSVDVSIVKFSDAILKSVPSNTMCPRDDEKKLNCPLPLRNNPVSSSFCGKVEPNATTPPLDDDTLNVFVFKSKVSVLIVNEPASVRKKFVEFPTTFNAPPPSM